MGNEALCVISVGFRLYGLLDLKGVGISLAESGMMKPYAGVSGLMFVHPESRCFDLGNIGERISWKTMSSGTTFRLTQEGESPAPAF